jgi:hypothetical protein
MVLDSPELICFSNILRGVPTNAQLTITLQRIGEANKAPIPPPPTSDEPPADEPAELDHEELPLDASYEEVQDAVNVDEDAESPVPEKPKKKHGSRVINFLKGTAKAGIEARLGTYKARAAVGSSDAKDHLGVLQKGASEPTGPVDYQARFQGKRGWIYINTSATVPCVSFSNGPHEKDLDPLFSIPIDEITELKKLGGLGWKSKIIVGWSMARPVVDALEITDKSGKKVRLTAIQLRDELFNRLVSMGPQKWESL